MPNAQFLYEFTSMECHWPELTAFVLKTAQVLHPALPQQVVLDITPASAIIEAQYCVQDNRLVLYRRSISGAVFQYFCGTVNKLITFDEFVALRLGIDKINRAHNVGGYYVLEGFDTIESQIRAYGKAISAFLDPYLLIIQKDERRHAKD